MEENFISLKITSYNEGDVGSVFWEVKEHYADCVLCLVDDEERHTFSEDAGNPEILDSFTYYVEDYPFPCTATYILVDRRYIKYFCDIESVFATLETESMYDAIEF